ncbi:MAG: cupin domain-containing protein [Planctomycetota bacterium]|nr:cupin domain-containing protein [Planctomycetota bacterium]
MTDGIFILYVADQDRAKAFYGAVLQGPPRTDVPGMTEFPLPGGGNLGLMPQSSIGPILGEALPEVLDERTLPKAEVYLRLGDAEAALERAVAAGGRALLPFERRSWGERVAYVADPDGQVLALATVEGDPMAGHAVPEAPSEVGPAGGPRPTGPGWYIANLADLPWTKNPRFGTANSFEAGERFTGFGLHVHVLEPGQPACLYHREDLQEGFLVLSGAARVLVDGQDRSLSRWDYFHCPPGVTHVLVGAGEGPCSILMIGRRDGARRLFYPVDDLAGTVGASSAIDTPAPPEAYVGTPPSEPCDSPWPKVLEE